VTLSARRARRRLETTIRAPWSPEGEAKAGPARDRPVEVKISSVLDDDGKQRFRIGLLSDLSLQREMAAAALRIQKLEDLQVMSLGSLTRSATRSLRSAGAFRKWAGSRSTIPNSSGSWP
jgi:hypothetical protein